MIEDATGQVSPVRLRLLGGFGLEVDGDAVSVVDGCRRLAVFLALHRGEQRRGFVAGSLWPDKPEARATANLRSAIWRLAAVAPCPIVDATASTVGLHRTVEVDLDEHESAAWSLLHDHVVPATATLRDLLVHDLLPGWYDDWVLLERERLAQLRVHAHERLVLELLAVGAHADAIDLALRLVAADPLRERSHLVLISAYAHEHNRAEARRQFDHYCELLAEVFGVPATLTFEQAVDYLPNATTAPHPSISTLARRSA